MPWRTDEGNPTGKSFERSNRRNAGKLFDIRAARNAQRYARAREYLRHFVVWQPAAITNARACERCDCIIRITHSVRFGIQSQLPHWLHQDFLQLSGEFLVAPVSDPDEIERTGNIRVRMEHANVGCLVPRPCIPRPTTAQVPISEYPPIGQHRSEERRVGKECRSRWSPH